MPRGAARQRVLPHVVVHRVARLSMSACAHATRASGRAGFGPGGCGGCHYNVHLFTRAILRHVDQHVQMCVQGLTMNGIERWHPDRAEHARVLSTWTTQDVDRILGLNPLLVGCWTCLMASVPAPLGLQRLMKAPWTDLWGPVRKYMDGDVAKEDSFPPGPRIIEQEM